MSKEFITLGEDKYLGKNADAWVCVCGNTDVDQGFFPCDADGVKMEPDKGKWKYLYVCDKCGRIIKQDTLEVVGHKKSGKDSPETF
jgi:hypothetical protein